MYILSKSEIDTQHREIKVRQGLPLENQRVKDAGNKLNADNMSWRRAP